MQHIHMEYNVYVLVQVQKNRKLWRPRDLQTACWSVYLLWLLLPTVLLVSSRDIYVYIMCRIRKI